MQPIELHSIIAGPIFRNEQLFRVTMAAAMKWRTELCALEYTTKDRDPLSARATLPYYITKVNHKKMPKSFTFPCHVYQEPSVLVDWSGEGTKTTGLGHSQISFVEDIGSLQAEAAQLKKEIQELFDKNKELEAQRAGLVERYQEEKGRAEKQRQLEDSARLDSESLVRELEEFLKQKSKDEVKKHESVFALKGRK